MGASDYFERMEDLEKNTENAISLFLPSVNNSLWELNDKQMRLDLLGILKFEEVNQVKIIVEGKDFISLGEELNNHVKVYEEKLGVKRNGEYFPLGTLVVSADLRPVYNHSVQNILFIFFLQLVKSTAVSIVILILLNIFLIKNLEQIFTYLKGYDFDKPNKPLSLKGKPIYKTETEVDQIVSSINIMSANYLESRKQRDLAMEALTQLNTNLEREISNRVEIITRQKKSFCTLINCKKLES